MDAVNASLPWKQLWPRLEARGWWVRHGKGALKGRPDRAFYAPAPVMTQHGCVPRRFSTMKAVRAHVREMNSMPNPWALNPVMGGTASTLPAMAADPGSTAAFHEYCGAGSSHPAEGAPSCHPATQRDQSTVRHEGQLQATRHWFDTQLGMSSQPPQPPQPPGMPQQRRAWGVAEGHTVHAGVTTQLQRAAEPQPQLKATGQAMTTLKAEQCDSWAQPHVLPDRAPAAQVLRDHTMALAPQQNETIPLPTRLGPRHDAQPEAGAQAGQQAWQQPSPGDRRALVPGRQGAAWGEENSPSGGELDPDDVHQPQRDMDFNDDNDDDNEDATQAGSRKIPRNEAKGALSMLCTK